MVYISEQKTLLPMAHEDVRLDGRTPNDGTKDSTGKRIVLQGDGE
jgi:hypothetical protein